MAEISEISLGAGRVPISIQTSTGKSKPTITMRLSTGRKAYVPLVIAKKPVLIAKSYALAPALAPAPAPMTVPPTTDQALQPQLQPQLQPESQYPYYSPAAPSTTIVTGGPGNGSGSGGGGGGPEEEKPVPAPVTDEKKSMLPWILLGILGLGTLYVVTRKQDDKRT